jgi:hypothetical protein
VQLALHTSLLGARELNSFGFCWCPTLKHFQTLAFACLPTWAIKLSQAVHEPRDGIEMRSQAQPSNFFPSLNYVKVAGLACAAVRVVCAFLIFGNMYAELRASPTGSRVRYLCLASFRTPIMYPVNYLLLGSRSDKIGSVSGESIILPTVRPSARFTCTMIRPSNGSRLRSELVDLPPSLISLYLTSAMLPFS